jgi:hypothetical protein
MATMENNYKGEVELPSGKVIKFAIKGTSKVGLKGLLKNANPKAKIRLQKK